MPRLSAAFALGAVLDAASLWVAASALQESPSVGTTLGVVLVAAWGATALAASRSTPTALDAASSYARTHGVAGFALAVLWAMDPSQAAVGGVALGATVTALAVLWAARGARLPGRHPGTWEALRGASASELQSLLRSGVGPDPAALIGRRFRALSLGPLRGPRGRRKSFRAFFHAPTGPAVEGCERAALQGSPDAAWAMAVDPGDGPSPGWFLARREGGVTRLDWRLSRRNAEREGRKRLLEILVVVAPAPASLLLGRRFFRLFGLLIPLGWFLLEDAGPHAEDGSRPRDGAW